MGALGRVKAPLATLAADAALTRPAHSQPLQIRSDKDSDDGAAPSKLARYGLGFVVVPLAMNMLVRAADLV